MLKLNELHLKATGLSHSYGNFQALAPIDLALKTGEISVLKGQNGAGKSALMLCLSGLMRGLWESW